MATTNKMGKTQKKSRSPSPQSCSEETKALEKSKSEIILIGRWRRMENARNTFQTFLLWVITFEKQKRLNIVQCLKVCSENYQTFAIHAQLVSARISGFRFCLLPDYAIFSLENRRLKERDWTHGDFLCCTGLEEFFLCGCSWNMNAEWQNVATDL